LTPPVTVTVAPTSASLGQSQTQQFTATVTGSSGTPTWSISPSVGGISTSGLYTAPASITATQTITVTATVSGVNGTAAVTLTPPASVKVTPATASLNQGLTQQFTATLTGLTGTPTWSISPSVGTISTSGLYTAPATITATQTVTVTATVSGVNGTATVTLNPPSQTPTTGESVARGATSLSNSNVIENTSYGPLSGNGGPFTIAFWFQSGNVNPGQSYVVEGGAGTSQWAVTYGFTSQQLQFYSSASSNAGTGTGITISDTNWHHIVYRKDTSGTGSWDEFKDGVKTVINSSIAFTLPSVASFYVLNADNSQAPCQCNIADLVIYNTAIPDSVIQTFAAGGRPVMQPVPLLYWPLSGTSTTEPDLSGNNNPGTVVGSIQSEPGPPYAPIESRTVTSSTPAGNTVIEDTSFGPLSGSNGPFTIAFWFQSTNVNPGQSYVFQGFSSGPSQWAVIYGYTSQEIEFYDGASSAPRTNSGITITDQNWHHVAYRKNASGSSEWDRFLDGVKTEINASINFTLPTVGSFYVFNADNNGALCHCSLTDIALYNTALLDTDIQILAQGARPLSLTEIPILY
jgi:hypothetical protein